jgi:hemolysin-activating ACP:hemolysin acyltransferase
VSKWFNLNELATNDEPAIVEVAGQFSVFFLAENKPVFFLQFAGLKLIANGVGIE